MAKKDQIRAEPDREPRTQYASLPWRRNEAGLVEVLVITSRETRRWVIPKGWPIKGMKPTRSAAQEAFEEAGVEGQPGAKLGRYDYEKRLNSGRLQHVRVTVFGLEVRSEAADWPERGQREKAWTSVWEAAERVDEPALKAIIAGFSPPA